MTEQTDTRIDANDALIPWIQLAWSRWGDQHLEWRDNPPEFSVTPLEEDFGMIELARNYRDTETFVDIAKLVITRDDMLGRFAWDVAPGGESPGGSPYARTEIRQWYPDKPDKVWDITFGLDSDNDGWYVQISDADGYDLEFTLISWRDVSPSTIAHYIRYYYNKVKGY